MAFATLAQTKEWLGITGTADDALLTRMLDAATASMEQYMARKILSASYTERRNGTGGNVLTLRNRPVTAVSSVVSDGMTLAISDGKATGYMFDDSALYYIGNAFSRGMQNVTVAYTAGYASAPADLVQACIEIVGAKYKERDRIGIQSKGLAGESISFIVKEFPDSARMAMEQYRNVVPV